MAELRAERLRVKPGSVCLQQLESDAKRKSAELQALQKRRQATIKRIETEGKALAQMELADLQTSVARLAEELQAEAKPATETNGRHHTTYVAADTGAGDDLFDEVMADEVAASFGLE